jgi:flavin reductase (DIM6/NTAB) family NADH-FMN oxidoreductase RutF
MEDGSGKKWTFVARARPSPFASIPASRSGHRLVPDLSSRTPVMDQDAKKKVLRSIVYGLYVFGVRDGDEAHAMTVNWVTQTSFEPPMLAVALENESHSLPLVRATGEFALSILPTGSRALAGKLGRSSANTPHKLDGVAHHPGPATGAPILDDATGWLECRLRSEHPSGDHTLVVAEVVEAGLQGEAKTLTLEETGFRYAG